MEAPQACPALSALLWHTPVVWPGLIAHQPPQQSALTPLRSLQAPPSGLQQPSKAAVWPQALI